MSLLFGLAPGGVCLADRSPGRWCALTAPFHPYLRVIQASCGPTRASGLISVALSLGSPPLGITQHPALWSSDFPQARHSTSAARPRPPDLLACRKPIRILPPASPYVKSSGRPGLAASPPHAGGLNSLARRLAHMALRLSSRARGQRRCLYWQARRPSRSCPAARV